MSCLGLNCLGTFYLYAKEAYFSETNFILLNPSQKVKSKNQTISLKELVDNWFQIFSIDIPFASTQVQTKKTFKIGLTNPQLDGNTLSFTYQLNSKSVPSGTLKNVSLKFKVQRPKFCYGDIRVPVPRNKIYSTPFSFDDIAQQLDAFIEEVYPTYNQIVTRPIITQEQINQLFSYLNQKAEDLISTTPYPGFSRIFTLVRNDGIVTLDKTVAFPQAYMVQGRIPNNSVDNFITVRNNDGIGQPLENPIQPINEFVNLKVYVKDDQIQFYDYFENFGTRKEFVQAATNTYGWALRPGIYVVGTIYCVARLVKFSSDLEAYFRLSYLRT